MNHHPAPAADAQFRAEMASIVPEFVRAVVADPDADVNSHVGHLAAAFSLNLVGPVRLEYACWTVIEFVKAEIHTLHPGATIGVLGVSDSDKLVAISDAPPFVQRFTWYINAAMHGDRAMAADVLATFEDDDIRTFIWSLVDFGATIVRHARSFHP